MMFTNFLLRSSALILGVLFTCYKEYSCVTLQNEDVNLVLNTSENITDIVLALDGNVIFTGQIGEGITLDIPQDCENADSCLIISGDISLQISPIENGFNISWSADTESTLQDCLDLQPDQMSWFGGPERWNNQWPVQNLQIPKVAYRCTNKDNGGVSERYWLNSRGGFVFVDDKVPLFLDQNYAKPGSLCFTAQAVDPFLFRSRNLLEYALVARENPKEAHLQAVRNFIGKPQGHPSLNIIQHPIWTTWAKYKKDITDAVVTEFAQNIHDQGFTGQIEIDDYWETCYGSLTFNDVQFPNINETVQTLKDLGFTVTLWVHPFVNTDCEEPLAVGEENGFFYASVDGNEDTSWWDGNPARHIDFTNEEAVNWFLQRLNLLKERHGIDGFKFDAGESDFPPSHSVFNGDPELAPNSLTSAYVRASATMGDLIEIRVASRTQDLPILLRMADKDSRWGLSNGLHALITTLLTFNMVGYNMVLPDMIGGNGYAYPPTAELLARWTQANVFMVTMQFSFLPWEITSDEFDGVAIIKKYVALHEQYTPEILKAINNSITEGTPVNPPIWWVDPLNEALYSVNDEFLLGEKILVAPVIVEGTSSRDVVFPAGIWRDGNDDRVFYQGPGIIRNYPAPIDVLPFFIKQ